MVASEDNLARIAREAVTNPEKVLVDIQRVRAERSLLEFIKCMWHVVEPGRDLVVGRPLEIICEHLEAVARGDIKKLLINVPPGFSKSLTTNVFFPVWMWVQDPTLKFISFAYAEHLTMRDNTKARRIIESESFQRMWGNKVRLDPEERAKGKFATVETGFKLATSVGGVSTGERGDFIIIDDPISVTQAESETVRRAALMWFGEALPTRVNDQADSRMVCIMQRVHEQDIAGHIIEQLGDQWDRLILPMRYEVNHPYVSKTKLGFFDWRTEEGELLWPERFPEHALDELESTFRSVGGDYAVASQMQQRPAPRDGGMFKRDDFVIVEPGELPSGGEYVRGWDLAATKDGKSAWTVGCLMRRYTYPTGRNIYIIEDIVRGRWSPREVDVQLKSCAESDPYGTMQDIPQDPGQAGVSQASHVAQILDGHKFTFGSESGSKEDRARPLAAQAGAGNVFMVKGRWNNAFLDEAANFPNGRFKDQIDGATRAYSRLLRSKPRRRAAAPETIS